MSLKHVTIACDWPGCEVQLASEYYLGFLPDAYWCSRGEHLYGPHLCPDHRHHTRDELYAALITSATGTPPPPRSPNPPPPRP